MEERDKRAKADRGVLIEGGIEWNCRERERERERERKGINFFFLKKNWRKKVAF